MTSQMKRTSAWHVIQFALLLGLIVLLAACGGKSAATNNSAQPTIAPQATTAVSSSPTKSASNENIPPACALLTVADVEKFSGYSGGAATPNDPGQGVTSCRIVTGKGALTVEVTASPGNLPAAPNQKTVVLEGGAKGIASTQTPFNQDWILTINFPNYLATLLVGGSGTTIDPDKKIAAVTKADKSQVTFAQAYDALARALAHNAATGAPAPSGVVQLGDPCKVLVLDDLKQVLSDFTFTGPDYQDSTFGGKQCIYRFRSDALKANGFVTLGFVTQPQFDALTKGQPLSGVGDAAWTGGGLLDLKKGNTFVHLAFTVASTDPNTTAKMQTLNSDGFKQLAQKVAARIK